MQTHKSIPQELLDQLVYDETSPTCLSWKERPARWRKPTLHAGTRRRSGYCQINRKPFGIFLAHRVVWALHHGDPGELEVDHIDNDPTNSRIENLQAITKQDNMSRLTGRGYYWHAKQSQWMVRCNTRWVGYFDTENEARAAYVKAKREATDGLQVDI